MLSVVLFMWRRTEIRSYEIPTEHCPCSNLELPKNGVKILTFRSYGRFFSCKDRPRSYGKLSDAFFRNLSLADVANMFGMELGQARMEEDDLKEISEIKNIEGRNFEWIRLKDKGHEGSTCTIFCLYRNAVKLVFPFIGDRDLINEQQRTLKVFASTTLRAGVEEIRLKHQLYLPACS